MRISILRKNTLQKFARKKITKIFGEILPNYCCYWSGAKGLAALLRSAGFFSGAVFFARMTLARSAFHGFQIGVNKCKGVYIL